MARKPKIPSRPLYLGGHPAVDLLNTRFASWKGPIDLLDSHESVLAFAVGAGLISEQLAATGRSPGAGAALELSRGVRWGLRRLLRHPEDAAALARINLALAEPPIRYSLRRRVDKGFALERELPAESPGSIARLLALQAQDLLCSAELRPSLVRCSNPECTLLFLSSNPRRYWRQSHLRQPSPKPRASCPESSAAPAILMAHALRRTSRTPKVMRAPERDPPEWCSRPS